MPSIQNTNLSSGGRVVIPAQFRQALGLKDGDELIVELLDGEIRLMTRAHRLRRARERVKRHISADHSLAEELIQERRQEAERE